jgi:hypothetical protein
MMKANRNQNALIPKNSANPPHTPAMMPFCLRNLLPLATSVLLS